MAAEIYSYSRSRGAFLGVSIDGTVVQADPQADARYYQSATNSGGPGTIPAAAQALMSQIARYAGTPSAEMASGPTAPVPQDDPENIRRALAESSEKLMANMDPSWREYLALPQSVYEPALWKVGDLEMLDACLSRYEEVAASPAYTTLTAQQGFQTVLRSLRQLVLLHRSPPPPKTTLPPPPARAQLGGPNFPG